jgi:hypothetical protein
MLLKVFCDHHFMEIFESFHIKLLTLLQKLLTESMVGLNFSSTDCNNVSGNVAKTAISKLSSSHIDRLPTPNAQNRNNNAVAPIRATAVKDLKAEAQVRANKKAPPTVTMFVLLLQVIREIVVCGGGAATLTLAHNVKFSAAQDETEASFLLLRANPHSGRPAAAVGALTQAAGKEPTCHLTGLTASLTLLWEAVVSDEHLLTNDSISCLLELCGVLLAVAQQCTADRAAFPGVSTELHRLLREILCTKEGDDARQFPYGSQVVSVSCAGSTEHTAAVRLVDRLNMSICGLVACMSGEVRDASRSADRALLEALQTAQQFEVNLLQEYVEALRSGLVTCGGVTALSQHAVATLIDRHRSLVPAALHDAEEGLSHLLARQGASDGGDEDVDELGVRTVQMVTALFDTIQAAVAAVESNRSTAPEFRLRAHNRTLVRELLALLRSSVRSVCVLAQRVVENQRFQFTVDEVTDTKSPYGPVVLELFGAIVKTLLDTANILFGVGDDDGGASGSDKGSGALAVVMFKTLISIMQATRWSLQDLSDARLRSTSVSAAELPMAVLHKAANNIVNAIFGDGATPSPLLNQVWKMESPHSGLKGVHYIVADFWFYSRFLMKSPRPFRELLASLPGCAFAGTNAAHLSAYIENLELYTTV